MTADTLDRPTPDQKPARELAEGMEIKFRGASSDYVAARKALLTEEIELRRHATRVAAMRQALPPGPVVKDYKFHDSGGVEHGLKSLADLFGDKDTLVTYFWMYWPERERPCPMCTNTLGAIAGNIRDIEQRAAFKVLGRSTVERQKNFATERGWRDLDFVQIDGDEYARDLGLIRDDGFENPALVVFKRDGEQVRLFWSSQMTGDMADEGQDPRDFPDLGVLWSVLDLTPEGRGGDWYPKLRY